MFTQVLHFFTNQKKKRELGELEKTPTVSTVDIPTPTVLGLPDIATSISFSALALPAISTTISSASESNCSTPSDTNVASEAEVTAATTEAVQEPQQLFIDSIPQVEFEQSRNLLQLDFFTDQSQFTTDFPQFNYLLTKPEDVQELDHEEPLKEPKGKKLETLNRRLTKTLRHRMSIYRPKDNANKPQVKRTYSTPNLL